MWLINGALQFDYNRFIYLEEFRYIFINLMYPANEITAIIMYWGVAIEINTIADAKKSKFWVLPCKLYGRVLSS